MNLRLLLLITLVSFLLLAGCAVPRRDIITSTADLRTSLPQHWATTSEAADMPITTELLELIDDSHLHQLVEQAVANNPDLRAAAHRLSAARTLLVETGALRLPQLDGNITINHHNQSFNSLGQRQTSTEGRYNLHFGWELDLWQRVAKQHQANVALNNSQTADFYSGRDALAARVIQAWVAVVSLRQAATVEEERVRGLTQLQNTIKRRYQNGIGNLEDLAAARAGTELALSAALALADDIAQAIRDLELMLGYPPRAELLVVDTLPVIHNPIPGVPLDTVTQRPDVAAAHWRLKAADSEASAAARALLPSINLTGNLSNDLNPLSDLLSGKPLWGILGSVSQPLFNGGRLRARADAQALQVEAAWEEYRSAILKALGQVEHGLSREITLVKQLKHLRRAETESHRNTRIQEERYHRGLADIMTFLQAQNQELDTKRQVLAKTGELLHNRIDLALATGAGLKE